MSIFGWAYSDGQRNIYNNLIRFKTPNDDYPSDQKCAALTASCLCTPLSAIEGLGLLLCGLSTCPTQLIGCRGKLTTTHRQKTVEFESCETDYGCPILPFRFQDTYLNNNHDGTCTVTESKGRHCELKPCIIDFVGNLEETRVVSSLTPTDCLWGGATTVSQAVCRAIQYPCCLLCFATNNLFAEASEVEVIGTEYDLPSVEEVKTLP